MSAPLSKRQKANLCQLSLRAWRRAADQARARGETFAETPDEFRHRHVAAACGKIGLRCCGQHDYHLVAGHLQDLLGEPGRAFQTILRGETNDRRVAYYKLLEACRQFGFHLAYAQSICRTQHHGASIDDLDTRALWRLIYTIRNRGLAARRKATPSPQPIAA